jgi:methylthioribose-1-phosphate isomerase
LNVNGRHYRTIWLKQGNDRVVEIIDQRWLPHEFNIEYLATLEDFIKAIKEMHVRGAGLIGAAAGYGMYIAAINAPDATFNSAMEEAARKLKATRPTAVNLSRAVDRQLSEISKGTSVDEKRKIALKVAKEIADEDANFCKSIGEHGLEIIDEISKKKEGETVNILTHCNAGWLAFVDFGSALAPIYEAYDSGIDLHVWVDETRPRNQGASLTAWELGEHGVPHTVIADNTGGYLMQRDMVDLIIVGADRVTRSGDVVNKIGTYLKAVAAKEHKVPFYVAFPSTTFDWTVKDGLKEITIEERDPDEVKYIQGLYKDRTVSVLLTPENSPAKNFSFDVIPAAFIKGLITERGICKPTEKEIIKMFPEQKTDRK